MAFTTTQAYRVALVENGIIPTQIMYDQPVSSCMNKQLVPAVLCLIMEGTQMHASGSIPCRAARTLRHTGSRWQTGDGTKAPRLMPTSDFAL